MTKSFIQTKLKWLVFPLLFLGFGTMQAQNFVSPDEAMIKLELKLADVYNGAEEGTVDTIDKEIADKLINKTAMGISNRKSIEAALDIAIEVTTKDYALYNDNIIKLKNEIILLLEKKD